MLWTNSSGLIWNIENVSTMLNYWVWSQRRRSKSCFWVGTISESVFFKLLNNDDEKCNKNSAVNLTSCLESGCEHKN